MSWAPWKLRALVLLAATVAGCSAGPVAADQTVPDGEAPGDLRIDGVSVAAWADLGSRITFGLRVSNEIAGSLETDLELSEKDAASPGSEYKPVARQRMVLQRGHNWVTISAVPKTAGMRVFRLELPVRPGEANPGNNIAEVTVKVGGDVPRVLLIAGQPGREYLFLVPALLRDPAVNMSCFLQSADTDYVQQGNTPLERLPQTDDEWAGYDVVILLDVNPGALAAGQTAAIRKWVAGGGGLVVVAGRYYGLAGLARAHDKVLGELLPVAADKGRRTEREQFFDKPFRVERTAAGKTHPVMIVSGDAKKSEDALAGLEKLDFYWSQPTGGPAAKAVALLNRARPDGGAGPPLMAVHRSGEGMVFFSAIDSTWRWRSERDGFEYDRFWSRLVRCVGQGRSGTGTKPVQAPPEERDPRPGSPTYPGKDPAFLVLLRRAEWPGSPELLTPQVRELAAKALGYLAETQRPDGSWSDKHYPANTGVTALCCLALMAEGSRPRAGKYGQALDRGLAFLVGNAQPDGVIAGKHSNRLGPVYEHVYAMTALLLAHGEMPWRPKAREVIARGIAALVRSQRPDGGWRYQFVPEGSSDFSVTGNVMWALLTARKAGFAVQEEALARGTEFVEKCALPDGTFRYRIWGIHASPSLGGLGVIALCNQGRVSHPLIPRTRDMISYDYRRHTVEDLKARRYLAYSCLYAGMAMYICGEAYWTPWFPKAVEVLAAAQGEKGELADESGNTIYSTAMSAILLQAPRGCLPVWQR